MNDNDQQTRLPTEHKSENLLLNLAFNIVVPTLILTKLSGEDYLGTKLALIVALLFPLSYGIRDFVRVKKVNLFSALGLISILLTGGISLMELSPAYIAIKEATIPAIFGLATLVSLKTPYPLVKTFIYNDTILNTQRVRQELQIRDNILSFEKLLVKASWLLAGSFLLSSILNYLLATVLLTAEPGTVEFNEQLGKMTALSFPVIAVPAMVVMAAAMLYLFKGIKKLTGLDFEDIIHHRKNIEPPGDK